MTIAKNYIQICLLAVVLVFVTACGDDDVREVEENGAITIAATANLESGRGTSVAIPVTINAAEGIQSLTVSAEGAADETLAVTAGETTVNATVNYDIPADALFSSSIDLTFTATDAKAQTATTTVTVTTGALIEELPTTYEFTRNGETTVSFSGQNERLDMVDIIKNDLLKKGDSGEVVSEQALSLIHI